MKWKPLLVLYRISCTYFLACAGSAALVLVLGAAAASVYNLLTHLVPVARKAAAFHGAGVEVALVVELEAGQAGVQLVEDGRQAAPQSQELRARAVEADAHGALQGHAATVAQQRAARHGGETELETSQGKLLPTSADRFDEILQL